jgi:hypothetical protein
MRQGHGAFHGEIQPGEMQAVAGGYTNADHKTAIDTRRRSTICRQTPTTGNFVVCIAYPRRCRALSSDLLAWTRTVGSKPPSPCGTSNDEQIPNACTPRTEKLPDKKVAGESSGARGLLARRIFGKFLLDPD